MIIKLKRKKNDLVFAGFTPVTVDIRTTRLIDLYWNHKRSIP